MFAHQGNLCDASDANPAAFTGPQFQDFDVATVGLGFHHFDDPDLAAQRLAARLRPGGVLLILDFLVHGHDDPHNIPSAAAATVMHHGFSEERIKSVFEGAGVGGDFGLVEIGTITHGHGDAEGKKAVKRVFLARGTKL